MKHDNLFVSTLVRKNILTLYGDIGRQWLENFSRFLAQYEKQWNFKAIKSFDEAQFNIVLDAEMLEKVKNHLRIGAMIRL
ncbi:MAG: hypothetical protein A3I77_08515 [Gammaproteobacteria bacterium RIFCSPLOWO2_02_FULL_42_14]|nr:MAG: hypothetical protein A3B71_07140 [Gammaproteobacteria bacterium RIFCSPHIGHO2_02_FULL_42_43]OGT53615.1 MAG: hypothetical protein A3E54_02720 [Gammaproteobacteria bacterium RIFCSPHIGHO2_12_FULL_41_25]OGT61666.1 MAG: hypothetical protein A3I77_08515 [Gammaproteobacteria bacterium RIFCSPLOWO2_02_FULL_42_14]OGT85425.1 MAG: hypothetical protein A3G86_08225 [Gammaproteobacteria bacterium RIFCSPLOWO2_12_FULL_42_18]